MPDTFFHHLRQRDLEREKLRSHKEAFIDECMRAQGPTQREEREVVEQVMMGMQDARIFPISSEAAQRQYAVRLALTTLFERGQLTLSILPLYLSLGYDLMKGDGIKGMIPAISVIRNKEEHIPHALLYPPDFFFVDPILDFVYDHRPASSTSRGVKACNRNLEDIVAFSHAIYDWNTKYVRTNLEVGRIPFALLEKAQGKRTSEVRRQRKLRGPEAQYLIHWRGIPFRLYEGILNGDMLDFFSVGERRNIMKGIFIDIKHEMLTAENLNPEIAEKIVQKEGVEKTLVAFMRHYVKRDEGPSPFIDRKTLQEFKSVADDIDFPIPREVSRILRNNQIVS
ncbi:hypothetical protein HY621_01090 [Candidatus Uhrbacteria bacterium]|nr:hypothetical protein [Candidatus Uhrbacteria bacterium]